MSYVITLNGTSLSSYTTLKQGERGSVNVWQWSQSAPPHVFDTHDDASAWCAAHQNMSRDAEIVSNEPDCGYDGP